MSRDVTVRPGGQPRAREREGGAVRRLVGLTWLDAVARAASTPVDGASGAAFRIAFGLLATLSALRFFIHDWIGALYIEPAHHFTYLWFDWVHPWPGWGMHAHVAMLAVLGLFIAAGYRYRVSIVLYFLGFTYVELLDQTTYLNHYYWISLTAFLMCFMPLHRTWSLDAARMADERRGILPAWVPTVLRGQLLLVYLFAGLAKLNPDWLLRAEPLRIWMHHDASLPVIGVLIGAPWAAYVMSWGAVVFELTIVGWFLWPRSRGAAYATAVVFHVLTAILLPVIGLFPWLMIAATPIFFAPDWPRTVARRLRLPSRGHRTRPAVASGGSMASQKPWVARLGIVALGAYAAVQLALPLRHLVYPGDVRWNEDGYRLSWRVMLTEKAGSVEFRVTDPATGARWLIQPEAYYTPVQVRAMSTQPDMILQAAHVIAEDFASRGQEVEVRADVFVSYNGHPAARLVDPDVDLAAVPRHPGPKSWLLPYQEPTRPLLARVAVDVAEADGHTE